VSSRTLTPSAFDTSQREIKAFSDQARCVKREKKNSPSKHALTLENIGIWRRFRGRTANHQYPRNGFLRNPIESYTIFLGFDQFPQKIIDKTEFIVIYGIK
jgi:hypothetical protein